MAASQQAAQAADGPAAAEAAAFAAAAVLLHQAADLLPLLDDGRTAAMPDGTQAREHLLKALALLARADDEAPGSTPGSPADVHLRVYSWATSLPAWIDGSALPEWQPLASILFGAVAAHYLQLKVRAQAAMRGAGVLLGDLAASRAVVAQLQRLGAGLTRSQLVGAALKSAIAAVGDLSREYEHSSGAAPPGLGPPPTAAVLQQLRADAGRCAELLMRLQPERPSALVAGADAATFNGRLQDAVRLYLQASRLAEQQGSQLWVAQSALHGLRDLASALQAVGKAELEDSPEAQLISQLAPALALVGPALERCRGSVPAYAFGPALAAAGVYRDVLEMMRHDAGGLPASSPNSSPEPAPAPASASASAPPVETPAHSEQRQAAAEGTCASCGSAELAFMCMRCRKKRYCSRRCQVADWREHQRSCVPWAAHRLNGPRAGKEHATRA